MDHTFSVHFTYPTNKKTHTHAVESMGHRQLLLVSELLTIKTNGQLCKQMLCRGMASCYWMFIGTRNWKGGPVLNNPGLYSSLIFISSLFPKWRWSIGDFPLQRLRTKALFEPLSSYNWRWDWSSISHLIRFAKSFHLNLVKMMSKIIVSNWMLYMKKRLY